MKEIWKQGRSLAEAKRNAQTYQIISKKFKKLVNYYCFWRFQQSVIQSIVEIS